MAYRIDVPRLGPQRSVEAGDGRVVSFETGQRQTAVACGIGKVRLQRQGSVVAGNGLVEPFEMSQDVAATVERLGLARINDRQPIEVGKRFLITSKALERASSVVQRFDMI